MIEEIFKAVGEIRKNSIFPQLGEIDLIGNGSSGPYAYKREAYAGGLTKRELFAGLAMVGLSATANKKESNWGQNIARASVQLADILIQELDKPK